MTPTALTLLCAFQKEAEQFPATVKGETRIGPMARTRNLCLRTKKSQSSPREGWPHCSYDGCTHKLGWASGRGTVSQEDIHLSSYSKMCERDGRGLVPCLMRELGESFLPTFAEVNSPQQRDQAQ